MAGMFSKYKVALLDSTFFVSRFSDEEKWGLQNIKVYVADSFTSEIEQYRTVLLPEKRNIYDDNVHFLNRNLDLYSLNFESFGEKCAALNNDMWGLVSLLVGLNAAFVVLTANQLLIERIILNDMKADIYDLNNNSFYHFGDYSRLKQSLEFSTHFLAAPPAAERVTNNDVLYKENGEIVFLGAEFKSGLEGNLYQVRRSSDSIAKIFKKDKLSADKYNNINNLVGINRTLGVEWALFPTSVLYYDSACTFPVGFIENYVSTKENLDNNPLFSGNPFIVPDDFLSKKQSYVVGICLKIIRQICYLNTFGFFISDYNLGNFATLNQNDNIIQMWDTDSFGFKKFFGNMFSSNYVESCNHPAYDTRTKIGAIDICNDALYQFVFSMLSLGDSPISEYSKKFKYDNPRYIGIARKGFFPLNIWEHMADVFRGKKPPSAEALMKQFVEAVNQFEKNPASDKTFKELFSEVFPDYEKDKAKPVVQKKTSPDASLSSNSEQGDPGKKKKRKHAGKLIFGFVIIVIVVAIIWGIIDSRRNPDSANASSVSSTVSADDTAAGVDASYFVTDRYVGYSEQSAIEEIERLGWTAECKTESSFAYKNGDVISSSCDDLNNVVVLTVSEGPFSDDEGINDVGVYLSVDQTDVFMRVGDSIIINVSVSGNCPDVFYMEHYCYPSGIVVEWGPWINSTTTEIKLTASSCCEGYMRFYVYDANAKKAVGFTDIYIKVN